MSSSALKFFIFPLRAKALGFCKRQSMHSSEFLDFLFFLASGIAMGENAMASWTWGNGNGPFCGKGESPNEIPLCR